MDTGTKAASIQVYDVASTLLFRIASGVFDALGKWQADPELKQPGYERWLELRTEAAKIARTRTLPMPETWNLFEKRFIGAHWYVAQDKCKFTLRTETTAVTHVALCRCEFALLCQAFMELVRHPDEASILNPPIGKEVADSCQSSQRPRDPRCLCIVGCSANGECPVHGDGGHLMSAEDLRERLHCPASLRNFLDGVTDQL